MMESSQENLQAWESFQKDFEESKEKDKIEGTHSNKLQYYMYLGKDSCVAIKAGILRDCYYMYEHECTCTLV